MSANREWCDDSGSLRRFGIALARDERFVLDDATAARLVDKLIRQARVAPVEQETGARLRGRVSAFARFIELHRRHVRRLALEDREEGWSEGPTPRGGVAVASAVRSLPLELREAVLLVVLAGFSHREAARALDIPTIRLLERVDRARERLAVYMGATSDPGREPAPRGAPHLRIIK